MAHSAPRLTIVVPSFRHGPFIAATLDSILSQGIDALQVVVADGGSRDGTVEILRAYAARHPCIEWLSEPDKGPADAVNKGLARARGEIVGIQSSDDLYVPGALARVLEAFGAHPDVGLLWGTAQAIASDGAVLSKPTAPATGWRALFAAHLAIPQGSAFFRRQLLEQTPGWNGRYYSCDLEFWLRLLFRTRAMRLDALLSQWRVHPEQRTKPGSPLWEGYRLTIRESQDLARAPVRVRRWARGSVHLMALDFPPDSRPLTQWRHALLAVLVFPEFMRHRSWRRYARRLPGLKRWMR